MKAIPSCAAAEAVIAQGVTVSVAGGAGPAGGVDWHAEPDLNGDDKLLPAQVEAYGRHGGGQFSHLPAWGKVTKDSQATSRSPAISVR